MNAETVDSELPRSVDGMTNPTAPETIRTFCSLFVNACLDTEYLVSKLTSMNLSVASTT